jgi:CRISPR system Cascade subunit CasB
MSLSEPERKMIGGVIARLVDASFGTGPLAELRRMDPEEPAPGAPALHRLLARIDPDDAVVRRNLRGWTLLVHLLALAAPELRGGESLGSALFAAGYSEGRLTRILEAREEQFADVLPRMVRFLVAKGRAFNPFDLARLVLRRGAENDRRRIARDYYRAEAKQAAAA